VSRERASAAGSGIARELRLRFLMIFGFVDPFAELIDSAKKTRTSRPIVAINLRMVTC
jgi:hypothetical protein